jgi:hypothetical protein
MSPRICSQDCGIARRCKLFIGTELERGAMVLEDPFVWPPIERLREAAAANLQAESYLEREHNARWAALSVAHATMKIRRRAGLKSGTGSGTSVRLENRFCKCLYAKIKAPILL